MRGTCTWLTSRWLISKSHNADTQSHFLAWSATGIPRKTKSLMQCFNISYEQIVCSHCSYFSSPLQSKEKYCTARKILASIISKTDKDKVCIILANAKSANSYSLLRSLIPAD